MTVADPIFFFVLPGAVPLDAFDVGLAEELAEEVLCWLRTQPCRVVSLPGHAAIVRGMWFISQE